MRASFVLSLQTLASQAESDCSKLCDFVWWRTATTADVQAELGSGAIAKEQNEYGSRPLSMEKPSTSLPNTSVASL